MMGCLLLARFVREAELKSGNLFVLGSLGYAQGDIRQC
jgi:hypothetical protein